MKKQNLLLLITLLLLNSKTFAQTGGRMVAPDCVKQTYPLLYTSDYRGEPEMKPEGLVGYITMSVPLSNLEYKVGLTYTVKHPIPGNECFDTISYIYDQEGEALRTLWERAQRNPEAAKKEDFSICLKFVNNVTDGQWTLGSYYSSQ